MKKQERIRALDLRKNGASLREIKNALNISLSTASTWTKNVKLSRSSKDKIQKKISDGRLKSQSVLRGKRIMREEDAEQFAESIVNKINVGKDVKKVILSLIYWCEGNKNHGMFFTNSDPLLIGMFMKLLRECYDIQEPKLRACIHLHDYHDEAKQLHFWSKVTNIPICQFIKSFRKKNTGKYLNKGYQGCLQVRYGDVQLARKLNSIAKLFINKENGSIG